MVAVGVLIHILAPSWFLRGIHDWGEREGYERVEHGEIHVSPFRGRVRINELRLVRDGEVVLATAAADIRISPLALVGGLVEIRLARLTGARVQVEVDSAGGLTVAGMRIAGGTDSRVHYSVDQLHVVNGEVSLHLPALETIAVVDNLQLLEGRDLSVDTLRLRDLRASVSRTGSDAWHIQGKSGALDGRIDVTAADDGKSAILPPDLSIKVDTIEVTGESVIHYQDTLFGVAVDDSLHIDEARVMGLDSRKPDQAVRFVLREHSPAGVTSSWEGEAFPFKGQPALSFRGRVESAYMTLLSKVAAQALGLEVDRGRAVVDLEVDVSDGAISGAFGLRTTDLRILAAGVEVLAVRRANMRVSLAELLKGELKIESADLDGARLKVERLKSGATKIAGLTLAAGGNADARPATAVSPIESLHITDGQLDLVTPALRLAFHVNELDLRDGNRIAVDTIALRDLRITVVLVEEDNWKLVGESDGTQVEYGFGSIGYEPDARRGLLQDVALKVDRVELVGDSVLRFEDRSQGPPLGWTLEFEQASILNIDSKNPGASSPFTLSMRSDDYQQLDLSGAALLFAPAPSVSLTGQAQAIKLTPLSPFTDGQLGFNIDTGQLDGDIEIHISQDKIDGRVAARINLLAVSTTDREKLRPFEKSLHKTLNLRQIVNLLQDEDGVITIGIPVGGDPRAPTFDIDLDMEAAINKAISNVTSFLVMPILTSVARSVTARPQRIATVSFENGSSSLDERARRSIARAAGRLEGHDRLATVCGTAGEHEFEGDGDAQRRQTLLELAGRRTSVVRQQLVEAHGIEVRRLVDCRPRIKDSSAGRHVEIRQRRRPVEAPESDSPEQGGQ